MGASYFQVELFWIPREKVAEQQSSARLLARLVSWHSPFESLHVQTRAREGGQTQKPPACIQRKKNSTSNLYGIFVLVKINIYIFIFLMKRYIYCRERK